MRVEEGMENVWEGEFSVGGNSVEKKDREEK